MGVGYGWWRRLRHRFPSSAGWCVHRPRDNFLFRVLEERGDPPVTIVVAGGEISSDVPVTICHGFPFYLRWGGYDFTLCVCLLPGLRHPPPLKKNCSTVFLERKKITGKAVQPLKTSVREPNMTKIATFGKSNRNKIVSLKISVQEPNHETCSVLDHYAHHKTPTNHCNKSNLVIDSNMTTHTQSSQLPNMSTVSCRNTVLFIYQKPDV